MTSRVRWLHRARKTALVVAVVLMVGSMTPPAGSAATPGEAGTDTALPSTDSQVTVSGRGAFESLEITVNQTKELVNQAISITWKGGTPTVGSVNPRYGSHFLQIMQCWGDDDGRVPENPGPPPEQCQFGAIEGVHGGGRLGSYGFAAGSFAHTRRLGTSQWPGFDPDEGVVDESGWWRPFRSVTGEVIVGQQDDSFNPQLGGGQFWLNPYFNVLTTNEIAGGYTRRDGTGQEVFEVATGLEANGLGCGQQLRIEGEGEPREPKCWLVVVPRGDAGVENEGSGIGSEAGIVTSPLRDRAWKNRIAIPLGFNPIGSGCNISEEPRPVIGSELPIEAITSWQSPLCDTNGLPPYSYGVTGDASARSQLLTNSAGTGMAVVSEPLDPSTVRRSNPIVYAPLTLSATVIGFNLERKVKSGVPDAEAALIGQRVERINLTPRLVAKLLTQSYSAQTRIIEPPDYPWVVENPTDIVSDPDFLRFNPEFELLVAASIKNLGGFVMPGRTSDQARQVWEWILADPEAKAWLDGEPDEWGMVVNPVYSTNPERNPSGLAFADPPPDSFPKSDPYCYQAPPQTVSDITFTPAPLCGTDWLPYAAGLREAARAARIADDGSRTFADAFAITPATYYRRTGPHIPGQRSMLAITDSPSAARFGLQSARLSRAGDDGDDRRFLAPDSGALTAAVEAMEPGAVADVLEVDPAADAPNAYPLTALTYAALAPLSLDDEARSEYAAFLDYAVGDGQVSGLEPGQLPPGYAPLPAALRTQGREAVKAVVELQPSSSVASGSSSPTGEQSAQGTGSSSSAVIPNLFSPSAISAVFDPTVLPELPAESEPDGAPVDDPNPLTTPILALARNRFVLPVLALIALASALGVVEITRRPGPQPIRDGEEAS